MAFDAADVRPDQRVQCRSCRTLATGVVAVAVAGVIGTATTSATAQSPTPDAGSADIAEEIPIPAGFPAVPGFPILPEFPPTPPPSAAKSVGERAVDAALTKLGAAYQGGAAGPDAFDCSGLVQWAYRQVGRELPRSSHEQLAVGTPTSLDDLQPGDLVSFYGGSHSGLYAGDGTVVHAATSGIGVRLAPISTMPYAGARRY
ncbi:C40 family peptidase [Nocardia sp. NPDC049190]|uniref:C40 family peptidase n=1 Tax=Nocardia sp. NPDC049190 TaxID=3155650 RepID=UPI0033E51322